MNDPQPSAEADQVPPRRATTLAVVVLSGAALLAYANTWSVPFLFDDTVTIVDNPTIRDVGSLPAALTPAAHTGVGGRPLSHLSFVCNYALGGLAVRGYHAVNLLLHVLAGLALCGIVRRILQQPGLPRRPGRDAATIALGTATLWLLHPLQTQTITYISQRTEALMAFFYLATLYGFVRGAGAPNRPGWLWLSVGACFAGMASKESMVTAPVLVLLCDVTFFAGTLRLAWQKRWRYYVALASSWLLLWWLLKGLGGRGVGFGLGLEWWRYALTSAFAITSYLTLTLWPAPLVFDYGPVVEPSRLLAILSAGCVAGLVVATWVGLRRSPRLAFLSAWFLLTLAPTTSVVPIPLQPMAENRVYLPSAAACAALALLLHAAAAPRLLRAWVLLSLALGALTLARNADYRSEVSIWSDAARKRPENPRAHHNLGNAWREAGRLEEARGAFDAALRLKPDYAEAEAALGGVLARLGRLDEAILHCRRALQLDPRTAEAHNNLGGALWEKGDLAGALLAYESALRIRPGFAEAHANRANLLIRAGRPAEAIAASQAALRARPGLSGARFTLACGLAGTGRLTEARDLFAAIVRDQPNHLDARYNLAGVQLQSGKRIEAIATYRGVLTQNPQHAGAHAQLANALLGAGQVNEALPHAEQAVRLQPSSAEAHVILGLALRRSRRGAEAISHFESALRLNPNFGAAREQLDSIRAAEASR